MGAEKGITPDIESQKETSGGKAKIQTKERISAQIRKGKEVEACGLVFYPILMENYEDFLQCREALVLRQSSFPVRYISQDYMSALFTMDADAIEQTGKPHGLFFRLIKLLFLSLRIEVTQEVLSRSVFTAIEPNTGKETLHHLRIEQSDKPSAKRIAEITPFQFSTQLRKLIAQQNGLNLPNESENVDLVRRIEEGTTTNNADVAYEVNHNVDDLIASVAYQSGIREREIDDWTVREFENRRRAIERDKLYTMYTQAELSGMVKFKHGSPAKSWCYDTIDKNAGIGDLAALGETLGGTAKK